MSADSWRRCPRCLLRENEDKQAAEEKVVESYGKVPAEEYEELRAEAGKKVSYEENLSAYYELGITEAGEFYVNYSGQCQDCGFKHEFQHSEQLSLVEGNSQ